MQIECKKEGTSGCRVRSPPEIPAGSPHTLPLEKRIAVGNQACFRRLPDLARVF